MKAYYARQVVVVVASILIGVLATSLVADGRADDLRATVEQQARTINAVNRRCLVDHRDGSAKCPPGTFATITAPDVVTP